MSKKLIIGKVGFTPRGEYDAATTYARIDVVTYNGNTYWSKVDGNLGNEPSADSEWWGVLIDTGQAKSATELANAAAKRAETATETTTTLATSVQAAEEARVTAEENRAAAEKERETKVASAIENADTSAENAQTATTNADIATTNANKAADEAEKINVSLADNVISITNRSGEEKTIAVPDADDEDIVKSSDGKISLKERGISADAYIGKGYRIVRRNIQMIDGVSRNIITSDMMNEANTIYDIRYDFELNADITMPSGCCICFNGGSISGANTLTLGNTCLLGFNGLKCNSRSELPIRTSICGIGSEWEDDSAERLSNLVNNKNKIIVDTDINCNSAVVSNCVPFVIVGDYNAGYRQKQHVIKFPSSKGFVLSSGTGEATTGLTWGHAFRNLRIVSKGTCIDFWPDDHVGTFSENTFENLYLESEEGDCINYGDNYTSKYRTAGFNQYFRQIQAKALNGACFRNIQANICTWQHIIIYGSKEGGFVNCGNDFHNVIFDQSSQREYGWVWNKQVSHIHISFYNCHFEGMKCPIAATSKFNGLIELKNFYADENSAYDDESDGLKHYFHFNFGNADSVKITNLRAESSGGDYATGYARFGCYRGTFINKGSSFDMLATSSSTYTIHSIGVEPESVEYAEYCETEFGKKVAPVYQRARIDYLRAMIFNLQPVAAADITLKNGAITNNGALGKSLLLGTSGLLYGYLGYNAPYRVTANAIFEWDILNVSDGDITFVHRNAETYRGKHCFNSFTGADLTIPPGTSAHCRFNSAQTLGAVVTGKYLVDIVSISPQEPIAGSDRPQSPWTGMQFFDTSLTKNIWWDGSAWVDNDGNPADAKTTGTTDERPTGVKVGYMYKDTTLGKLIVWDGSAWVNMDGTALS